MRSIWQMHWVAFFFQRRFRIDETDEPVQIGAGYAQASGCQRLVPVVLQNGFLGNFKFELMNLLLKRAAWMEGFDEVGVLGL